MNIDTDRVIAEVRFRPALWDSSNELYKDRDAKTKAWHEVCQEVIQNFDNLSSFEKRLTEKQVQQRWKTARDAYVRSKTECGKRKKYIYFDCLHFLDKKHEDTKDLTLEGQKTLHSYQTDSVPVSQYRRADFTNSVTSNKDAQTYAMPTTSRGKTTTRRYHTKLQRGLKKTQRRRNVCDDDEFRKEMLKLVKDNMKLMQNDDMAFFSSLLPITQAFDNYQKLAFRSDVLKKAMEISNFNSSRDPLEFSAATATDLDEPAMFAV